MCGQMFNPDKIDVNTLNIKGIPKQVEISEESLCSEKDIEKQKLFFDSKGCCVECIKETSNRSKITTTVVKYRYKHEKLDRVEQIERTGQYSDTLIKEYIYTEEGSLSQKTCYHMDNGKPIITDYTTYETDSIDNKTILETFYLRISKKNSAAKFKKYLDRSRYNSAEQLEYFSCNGLDYRIHYDSIKKEKTTFQCFGRDSSVISIQKYDKYGKEIEHISNIKCPNNIDIYAKLFEIKDCHRSPFVNNCIKECELAIAKDKETSSKINIIYTFYNYDELGNIKEKFTIDICSGSMFYSTYDYIF